MYNNTGSKQVLFIPVGAQNYYCLWSCAICLNILRVLPAIRITDYEVGSLRTASLKPCNSKQKGWLLNCHSCSLQNSLRLGSQKCNYQFLPLHKGAVITRREWGPCNTSSYRQQGVAVHMAYSGNKTGRPGRAALYSPSALPLPQRRLKVSEAGTDKHYEPQIVTRGNPASSVQPSETPMTESNWVQGEANQYRFLDWLANYYNKNIQKSKSNSP